MTRTIECRVCLCKEAWPYKSVGAFDYWRCDACRAIFMDEAQLPDREFERQRYQLHDNNPEDPGYRRFLNKLAAPLLERIPPNSEGLDFGCGPGPALVMMLTEAGYSIRLYDPFFHPDQSALDRQHDFVTCTETVEHFHRPYDEFARLDSLLRPGGLLGIMTTFLTDESRFADWHYRRDPTHVVFYRAETFEKIAALFGWECEIPAKNIVFMQKNYNKLRLQ